MGFVGFKSVGSVPGVPLIVGILGCFVALIISPMPGFPLVGYPLIAELVRE